MKILSCTQKHINSHHIHNTTHTYINTHTHPYTPTYQSISLPVCINVSKAIYVFDTWTKTCGEKTK